MSNAYAPSTSEKYSQHAFFFVRFILAFGLLQLWADPAHYQSTLLFFVVFLARSVKYRTCKQYLSGLRHFFLMHNLPEPYIIGGFRLEQVLAGIKRTFGDEQNPKRPITPRILMQFYYLLSLHILSPPIEHLVLFAAMLVAFFAFLRKGNVTSKSVCWAAETHALARGDIFIDRDAYVMWLRLKKTKTIQFGERILWVPIRGLRGSPLDVIRIYDRMVAAVPAADTDPAFMLPDGSPLTHGYFVYWVKKLIALIGLDPGSVAGHSFRRGGASFAAYCGVPDAFIKLIGDWRSNAYLAYIIIPATSRVSVTDSMIRQIAAFDLGDSIFG